MVSGASDPSSEHREKSAGSCQGSLIPKITMLKEQIQSERVMDIEARIAANAKKLKSHVDGIIQGTTIVDPPEPAYGTCDIIPSSVETASCLIEGYASGITDKEPAYGTWDIIPSSVETASCLIEGYASGITDKEREIKLDEVLSSSTILPAVEKIPRYTSWIFLQRNQIMTDDQSVIGKRRIYYDANGNEALVCSDESEGDIPEPEKGEKYEFSECEDRILRLIVEEFGLNDEAIEEIQKLVGATSLQIQERCKELKENPHGRHTENASDMFLEKRLTDAVDSFDTLFCRRCLVFDCRLHGCSQPLIFPNDKQPIWSEPESDSKPCSDKCYLNQQTKEIEGECNWKPFEKDLFFKGLEIFGKNSCLISRNLLSGLKTCPEVYDYLHRDLALTPCELDDVEDSSLKDSHGTSSVNEEQETPARSRPIRKKGKARRRKYPLQLTATKKKNNDGLDRKQYTPCACQPSCGKDCPCLKLDNCCEKYCGCSRTCKNRFRGCHCAKSQCRSPKCPCYASGRECDPDVCRNCWASCGDGTLGEPPKQGDGQCGNMRILLRQKKPILLGRSDIIGWGAFAQNDINKDDYLGEYTGELIPQDEADMRGKIYDRIDSSFLFNLNNEWCIDACRKGSKLKFANHSSKPNCYCQVRRVGGEHRVGIYAKERIQAQQELFYDYAYGGVGPSWAKDPKKVKKDEASTSKTRAKKNDNNKDA